MLDEVDSDGIDDDFDGYVDDSDEEIREGCERERENEDDNAFDNNIDDGGAGIPDFAASYEVASFISAFKAFSSGLTELRRNLILK